MTDPGVSAATFSPSQGYLDGQSAWLINLRWFAALGVLLAAGISAKLGWLTAPKEVFAVAGLMILANFFFLITLRRTSQAGESDEQHLIGLQICMDLCLLTLILHWSGGIENPFALFFVFHAAISTMLLPMRQALMLSGLAVLLFGGTILGEANGILPHFPLLTGILGDTPATEHWRSPLFVAGYLSAFSLTLFGVQFFVNSVEMERQGAEHNAREKERIALSRERLARIGELSSGVAHTIRNPLHGVMNCTDLLKEGPLKNDPSATETLDLMSEGLNRIEIVTKRLLTLSRDTQIHRSSTDLNALILESLKFVDVRLDRHRVVVQTEFNDLPEIPVDQSKVGEVLINLVDNAVHACKEGGTVYISTYISPSDEDKVVIEVRDTGTGIPANQIDHIFDPFFTTKAIGEGSGLGLPIARRIIEQHDGIITAESPADGDTTFKLYFPQRSQRAEVQE